MQPNGQHLHEHVLKASVFKQACTRSRKPGANASRHIEETRWESGTFLRDDKPSQSHTSTGMLGKQRVGEMRGRREGLWGQETRDEERLSLH